MSTRYEAVRALEPGKPVEIHERDERGFLVGAWIGYWNFKRGIVMLYPDVRNRFVNWPGGRIPDNKRQISDRFVSVRETEKKQNAKGKATSSTTTVKADEDGRTRKAPLPGQERIKFWYGKRKD